MSYSTDLCSKYKLKVRGLSGNGMQIAPSIEDPDRSCKVACQDELIVHRFYLVNGEQGYFPFGTKCSKNENRYCVNGKCLVIIYKIINFYYLNYLKFHFRNLEKIIYH